MKKTALIAALSLSVLASAAWGNGSAPALKTAGSAGNFTIGVGPIGNFYLTDRRPEMSPGVGALIYFDYRWSPELSTQTSIFVTDQGGDGRDAGEDHIIFMGIPAFDIKYFFVTNPSRWDPYALVGIGYYVLTNGQAGRGMASGLGAQLGAGADYYVSAKISLGVSAVFRSIAMLGNGATGTFPLSLAGHFGFHF